MEKYCKRRGSQRIWKLFKDLAADTNVELEESECFFECQSGPNVRLDKGVYSIFQLLHHKDKQYVTDTRYMM